MGCFSVVFGGWISKAHLNSETEIPTIQQSGTGLNLLKRKKKHSATKEKSKNILGKYMNEIKKKLNFGGGIMQNASIRKVIINRYLFLPLAASMAGHLDRSPTEDLTEKSRSLNISTLCFYFLFLHCQILRVRKKKNISSWARSK